MVASSNVTTSVHKEPQVPFLIRVLWFFLIGWHITFWWVLAAWFFNLTIIGLPIGLWMLNRVPLVLTLRTESSYRVTQAKNGVITEQVRGPQQQGWLLRLIYFVLIGWWLSLIWALLGWLLCVTIIGLPFGVWMLNRLPAVTTLMKH